MLGALGGTWVNACCVCAAGFPYPILVYFVANYRPHLSHFLECNFRDPNLVTFYLFIYLVNPLKRSSINYLRRTITIQWESKYRSIDVSVDFLLGPWFCAIE